MSKQEGSTTVKEVNGTKLVRRYYYGFRCSALDVSWEVHTPSQAVPQQFARKRDALAEFDALLARA